MWSWGWMWNEGIWTQHQACFYNFLQGVERATLNSLRLSGQFPLQMKQIGPNNKCPWNPSWCFTTSPINRMRFLFHLHLIDTLAAGVLDTPRSFLTAAHATGGWYMDHPFHLPGESHAYMFHSSPKSESSGFIHNILVENSFVNHSPSYTQSIIHSACCSVAPHLS